MPPRPGALFSFFVLSLSFSSFHYMYIEIDHLCKRVVARDTDGVRRERVILDDITLSIDRGEFVCLLGFSGCGKSTLLNLLAGFDQPTSGRITVDGQPVTRPSSSRVMIFQQYGLLPWRTVEQNVMLGLEAQRLPRVDRQRLAEEYLRLVGLSDQARNFPARLSGGATTTCGIGPRTGGESPSALHGRTLCGARSDHTPPLARRSAAHRE